MPPHDATASETKPMEINTDEVKRAVIAQSVAALVEQFGDVSGEIGGAIRSEASEQIIKRVHAAVDTEIKRVVETGLEHLIFPSTNVFGEEKSPAKTMREYVAEIVHNTFTEYLDRDGKPTRDSWYTKPENQRVQRVIKEAISDKIRDEVMAASTQIHKNINHYLGEFIKLQLNEAAAKLK